MYIIIKYILLCCTMGNSITLYILYLEISIKIIIWMNINILFKNTIETCEICMSFVIMNISNEKGRFESKGRFNFTSHNCCTYC